MSFSLFDSCNEHIAFSFVQVVIVNVSIDSTFGVVLLSGGKLNENIFF